MTTDRELLERAARAYWSGEIDDLCSIRWLEEDQAIGYTHGDNQDHNGTDVELVWNPLTDDGDALRLAVKLDLNVFQTAGSAYAVPSDDSEAHEEQVRYIDAGGNAFAATRRAIVRAAAAMASEDAR